MGLTCSSKTVNQFIDLLNTLNVKVLATTCNSLCLNAVNTLNKANAVIVDVKYTRTVINVYDENGFIKFIHEIPRGFITYMASLKRILSIPQNMDITDIVKKIRSMNEIDANIPLIHFHGNEFLEIQEATASDILKAINHANKLMLETIYNKLVAIRTELPDLPKLVKVNVIEEFMELGSYVDNCVVNNDITFSVLKNNVLGLEDSGVNDMIACGKYLYEEQLNKHGANTYSIDPYVSQQKANENINKSIILKIGILSTQ
ncbi:hypothetical protein FACS1894166_02310 [Bacilli bacterium]|nr:hypothetical protein FACS1894166_02310 [Bacilli bacterium]